MPTAPDDFAPSGSDRTRRGRGPKPENLPPGRRNAATAKPVAPTKNGPPESKRVTGDGPRTRARAEAARRRAEAAAAEEAQPDVAAVAAALTRAAQPKGKLTPIEPEDESLLDEIPEPEPDLEPEGYDEYRQQVGRPDPFEELQVALMYGLRLRIIGEGDEAGSWEDFDRIATEALKLSAPDPLDNMTPAQRFLWGEGGLDVYEGLDTPQLADVPDIINLGSAE